MQVPFKSTERIIQKEFVEKMNAIKIQVEKSNGSEVLLYGDATHMNGIVYPSTIWKPKGKRFNEKFYCQKHQNKISVMGAIDALGAHELTSLTTTGSVNKQFMLLFFEYLSNKYANTKIHLVLDNAKYQKNEDVLKKAKELGIELVFLPPYCPNLNLIERLWKFLKKKIAKANLFEKISQLNLLLSNFIRKFAEKEFEKELSSLLTFKFQII